MLFIVGGQIREVHFPRILEDEQWNRMAELSGLPPEARSEIDDYIGYYRELRPDAQTEYGRLWKKLDGARKKEIASLKTLHAIILNPNFFPALAMGLDGQEKIPAGEVAVIRKRLEGFCKEKQSLVDWYNKAVTRLHHGERGRHRSSLFTLVLLLNSLLMKYTGKRISRAKRRKGKQDAYEYVWEVCRIANPDLELNPNKGRNTVDGVIRQVVTQVLGNEDSIGIQSWAELIPHWKEEDEWSLEDPKWGIRVDYKKQGETTSCFIDARHVPLSALPIIFPLPPFIPDRERS
jgi:hypothetical protein